MIRFLADGIYITIGGDLIRLIAYYGVILMVGAVAGAWLAAREAKRRGRDPEIAWDLLIYLILGGVIGARLWHVFTPPPSSIEQGFTTIYYLTHPLDLINLRLGGLGIPGGIIGGAIALYFYTRRNKLSFAEWADFAAPGVALGQAIGRFGNYINQELYGAPTNLPWKLYIDPARRVSGFEDVEYFHPLWAYESILSLANMFFLLWVARRFESQLKKGDVILTYLITYPVIRFGLDFLRLDASRLAGVNANQTVAAIVAVVAAAALIWRHQRASTATSSPARKRSEAAPAPAARKKAVSKKTVSRKTAAKKAAPRKTPAKKKTS
jgi:phosphatidylglycerol:prolipoprotein diacylglycerol transferase